MNLRIQKLIEQATQLGAPQLDIPDWINTEQLVDLVLAECDQAISKLRGFSGVLTSGDIIDSDTWALAISSARAEIEELKKMNDQDIVYRLRKRAEIRRQIPSRRSVQEGAPDRLANLLDEAANEIAQLRERLEIGYAFDSDGNRVEIDPDSHPDGIECRDTTIEMQDQLIDRLQNQRIFEIAAEYRDAGWSADSYFYGIYRATSIDEVRKKFPQCGPFADWNITELLIEDLPTAPVKFPREEDMKKGKR